jgi:hypothetical protein
MGLGACPMTLAGGHGFSDVATGGWHSCGNGEQEERPEQNGEEAAALNPHNDRLLQNLLGDKRDDGESWG